MASSQKMEAIMKRTVWLFLVLFVLLSCVSVGRDSIKEADRWANLEAFNFDTLNAYIYNDVYKRFNKTEVSLGCKPKENIVQIYFKDYLNLNCLELSDNDRVLLISYLNKYIEWNSTAIKNKDKFEKTIGKFQYYLYWLSAGKWYSQGKFTNGNTAQADFLSQSNIRHQFVLFFTESKHWDNEFISKKPETLYFEYEDAVNLLKKLDLSYIKNKITLETKKQNDLKKYK
jgi:hypothetical protein